MVFLTQAGVVPTTSSFQWKHNRSEWSLTGLAALSLHIEWCGGGCFHRKWGRGYGMPAHEMEGWRNGGRMHVFWSYWVWQSRFPCSCERMVGELLRGRVRKCEAYVVSWHYVTLFSLYLSRQTEGLFCVTDCFILLVKPKGMWKRQHHMRLYLWLG